ncbi:SMI1/KNR4 family protein [uncultured Phocaeicola sp.]|uniref:SMI1/KNR4 family protein n=1 Tax=uncultured Phocaeicola sp. TaxID=990718 RepID=UPI00263325A1|nr:SMI1/KNR4 family protein [uncultured Phocaeicola sp.]
MENIIDMLKEKDCFCSLKGVTEDEIRAAEQTLGLSFTKEYRAYLQAFGLASFQGHELTGIIKSPRLSVIAQTVAERNNNAHIPDDMYVIEIANIDGIVIWQGSTGEIFETIYDGVPTLICKSFSEYIEHYTV